MTEIKETKEHTIHKLTNFSWQRKLNERNSFPKCVKSENDQFWKPVAKQNSDSESRPGENKKDSRIHQTPMFKTKNGFVPAEQYNDDRHYVKIQGDDGNNVKKLVAVKESSTDVRYERQPKNRNDHGSTYLKDEKENMNIQRNGYRSGNQINSQNQKYFKRDDKNQNFRRDGNVENESPNHDSSEGENVKKDQRFAYQQQSRSYNHNIRGYHRNQEKFNHQNNFNKNDAKNRSNYQNSYHNQHFRQNTDNEIEQSSRTNDNLFSHVSSNYAKQKSRVPQEKSTLGIHYQRTFSHKMNNNNCNVNVANNQSVKSMVGENFIPQTVQFAQLDLSSENCTNVENIYSRENDNQYKNFVSSSNCSTHLFSDQFTAGISEPVPTDIYPNDAFRTSIQSSQSSNIPVATANFIDSCIPSSQSLVGNNFTDCSYSNQISAVRPSSQSMMNGNFIDCSYSNQMATISPPSQSLTNSDFTACSYMNQIAAASPPSHSLVNDNFNDSGYPNQNGATSAFANQFTLNDNISTMLSSLSPNVADFIPKQNQIQNSNQMEFSSPMSLQRDVNLEDTHAFLFSTPNNTQYQNANWLSSSDVSNCNETTNMVNTNFQNGVMLPTFSRNNSSEGLNEIFNQQQTAVLDTPSNGQMFNFNGRMVNLSGKDNQSIINEHPPSYDNVQSIYTQQNNSIGGQSSYDINIHSGANNYCENLNFNNQQISNILQIASLNLDQESIPISPSSCERINDMFEISNVDVNVNESIVRQTNASILSQTVVNNASNLSVCEVRRNSHVNIMQDYYRKPGADVANNLKCNESEELNSKLEIVAQQLFNVNKYVTSAEMNAGKIAYKDTLCDSISRQFNMTSFRHYKNEMEKYRQCENMPKSNAINTLLPSNDSNNYYDNLFTSVSVEANESFPSQTSVDSNFIPDQKQQFVVGPRYYDGNLNNNSVLPTEFTASTKISKANSTSNFQQNYGHGRNSTPMTSVDRHRYADTPFDTGRSPHNHQTSFKNEFARNNNKRLLNNEVRITNDKPTNSMFINVKDDYFVNFNRKACQEDSGNSKFNVTVGKAPSVGILKKSTKSVDDASVQFEKSPKDQVAANDSCILSKENSPSNKRVSFSF